MESQLLDSREKERREEIETDAVEGPAELEQGLKEGKKETNAKKKVAEWGIYRAGSVLARECL